MLHEYRDLITELKGKNARFDSIFEKHNELDQRIKDIEEGRERADSFELETLKKEKLRLKDEAYAILMEYKNSKAN
ncbi:YdcH family protein [Campylobacter hyointestinalis]|uniref:FlhB domain-containing protein n=1 Tax=Campylobacter hyointestinalis subsp. hyointestinalis TaxID=91352 RepID=A0A9W5ANX7_CAMHY|nr:YdcH family protein [Campylobacter hyointestinalis]MDL2346967.1 YdcH family protein [Campylobacter hyointestinalis]MDL2348420.1 YdcH family protein [Campylobacter hyointestinalis]MDL2350454.1 YdcH family protein [Campylobacter hyointestinalis]MDM1025997.1 YdcH family protein [Campylobacter hyointestinalis]MDM1027172.1 YdcH family protein [Campylobacter hyointestinalis]